VRSLRIDDNLAGRTAKQHVQSIQNIAPQHSLATSEVGLQTAWNFLTVNQGPNPEGKRSRGSALNTAEQTLTPNRGFSCSNWQSAQGRTLASAPVSGMTRSKTVPVAPFVWRNSTLIKGSASPA
jgi:hypothetical protein